MVLRETPTRSASSCWLRFFAVRASFKWFLSRSLSSMVSSSAIEVDEKEDKKDNGAGSEENAQEELVGLLQAAILVGEDDGFIIRVGSIDAHAHSPVANLGGEATIDDGNQANIDN